MNTRALNVEPRSGSVSTGIVTGILIGTLVVLTGILVGLAPARAGAAPADDTDDTGVWASVGAPGQKLREGCRPYTYRYDVTVPGDEWMVELFLVGPQGSALGSTTLDSADDAATGKGAFKVCRSSTRPGMHKIRIKVTSVDGRDQDERWMSPTKFRLRR